MLNTTQSIQESPVGFLLGEITQKLCIADNEP